MRTVLFVKIMAVYALVFAFTGCTFKSFSKASDPVTEDSAVVTQLRESPEWVADMPEAENADQLFVVANYEGTTAWVSMHEKDADGKWQMIMTTPGYIGKNGLGKTREGDGMTPQGVFTFDKAFGIAGDPGCSMNYVQVDENDYWSGDEASGMHYNEMVDINDYPDLDVADSIHIADYIREYRYCLNIDYNKEGEAGKGSAIFLHCLGARKPYTGGSIAIPESQMKFVMQHVKSGCVVVIDSVSNLGASF